MLASVFLNWYDCKCARIRNLRLECSLILMSAREYLRWHGRPSQHIVCLRVANFGLNGYSYFDSKLVSLRRHFPLE